jgi:hypothetical protein
MRKHSVQLSYLEELLTPRRANLRIRVRFPSL